MNTIDATDRTEKREAAEAPSLLAIILDTNPHAWSLLADSLSLSKAVANLLVFINAHLAINHANRVAVLASHAERAEWLYPTPARSRTDSIATSGTAGDDVDQEMQDGDPGGPVQPQDDANKYRPFAHIEHALLYNLRRLIDTTPTSALTSTPATMVAGALTKALTYISKQSQSQPSATTSTQFNYSDATALSGGSSNNDSTSSAAHQGLTSRILVLSVSGDLANQYIPIMNTIFACQRLTIPIDILKLAGDTVFLQQAADATGGIYLALDEGTRPALLQYLMFAYLPDAAARHHLTIPGDDVGVDFRAACFCHRRIVDVGYVCSICLSIFCEPLRDDNACLTCGSRLSVAGGRKRPAVVPKNTKMKRKKRKEGGVETPEGRGTPVP